MIAGRDIYDRFEYGELSVSPANCDRSPNRTATAPRAELARREHAPLPVNCCELHCSTLIFGARPYEEKTTAKRRHSPGTPLSW